MTLVLNNRDGSRSTVGLVPNAGGGYSTGITRTDTPTASGGVSTIRTIGAISSGSSIASQQATDSAVAGINAGRSTAGQPSLVGTMPVSYTPKDSGITDVHALGGTVPGGIASTVVDGGPGVLIQSLAPSQSSSYLGSPEDRSFQRINLAKMDARVRDGEANSILVRNDSDPRLGYAAVDRFTSSLRVAPSNNPVADIARNGLIDTAGFAGKFVVGSQDKVFHPKQTYLGFQERVHNAIHDPVGSGIIAGKGILAAGLITGAIAYGGPEAVPFIEPILVGAGLYSAGKDIQKSPSEFGNTVPDTVLFMGGGLATRIPDIKVTNDLFAGKTVSRVSPIETKTTISGRPDLSSNSVYANFDSTTPISLTTRTIGDVFLRRPPTTTNGEIVNTGFISGERDLNGKVNFDLTGQQTSRLGSRVAVRPIDAKGITFRPDDSPVSLTSLQAGDRVSVSHISPSGSYIEERYLGGNKDISVTTPVKVRTSNIITQTGSTERGLINSVRSRLFTPTIQETSGIQTTRVLGKTKKLVNFDAPKTDYVNRAIIKDHYVPTSKAATVIEYHPSHRPGVDGYIGGSGSLIPGINIVNDLDAPYFDKGYRQEVIDHEFGHQRQQAGTYAVGSSQPANPLEELTLIKANILREDYAGVGYKQYQIPREKSADLYSAYKNKPRLLKLVAPETFANIASADNSYPVDILVKEKVTSGTPSSLVNRRVSSESGIVTPAPRDAPISDFYRTGFEKITGTPLPGSKPIPINPEPAVNTPVVPSALLTPEGRLNHLYGEQGLQSPSPKTAAALKPSSNALQRLLGLGKPSPLLDTDQRNSLNAFERIRARFKGGSGRAIPANADTNRPLFKPSEQVSAAVGFSTGSSAKASDVSSPDFSSGGGLISLQSKVVKSAAPEITIDGSVFNKPGSIPVSKQPSSRLFYFSTKQSQEKSSVLSTSTKSSFAPPISIFRERTSQVQVPITIQVPKQGQSQDQVTGTGQVISFDKTPPPPPVVIPPFSLPRDFGFRSGLPGVGGGGGKGRSLVGHKTAREVNKFVPGFSAAAFNLKGGSRKASGNSGFELRGVPNMLSRRPSNKHFESPGQNLARAFGKFKKPKI